MKCGYVAMLAASANALVPGNGLSMRASARSPVVRMDDAGATAYAAQLAELQRQLAELQLKKQVEELQAQVAAAQAAQAAPVAQPPALQVPAPVVEAAPALQVPAPVVESVRCCLIPAPAAGWHIPSALASVGRGSA